MVEMLMSESAEVIIEDLREQIQSSWQRLADDVFSFDFFSAQFKNFLDNPLIIAITTALLVVAGFVLFARAISIFNIKH
ncbi:MAG: hypothetical protein ACI4JT_06835 [Oscillospiraceae bacterium]